MNDASSHPVETQAATSQSDRAALRRRIFMGIGAVLLLAALIYGGWKLFGPQRESTNNAYVGADVAQVTPLVNGPVREVRVSDTQQVQAGQVLVLLDDADARQALAQAEADLINARNKYGESSATGGALAAHVGEREADIGKARAEVTAAQADLRKAATDLERRRGLTGSGAVSGQELTDASRAYAAAQANVAAARAGLNQSMAARRSAQAELVANQAKLGGPTAADNPEVAAAQAKMEQAKLALARTQIRAPIAGVVTRRQVQVGQQVAAGTPIMIIVPVDKMYVDANFKEGQLRKVRIGQPVRLTSDLYGGDVVYHGRVIGIGGGTGSAFALIPAQNATGNWIKVVQRLPVRIALDPRELKDHPLRVGLSMEAEVDLAGAR
jgi:membrane fusion protein, multidrug efflux system